LDESSLTRVNLSETCKGYVKVRVCRRENDGMLRQIEFDELGDGSRDG